MKHGAPNNAGIDGQGSYFNDELRSIVSNRFRAMTLSRNPELDIRADSPREVDEFQDHEPSSPLHAVHY
jgi:hypothetical protein